MQYISTFTILVFRQEKHIQFLVLTILNLRKKKNIELKFNNCVMFKGD
jgi:hypothetical protein